MRHLECQLEEKNQELLRVSHMRRRCAIVQRLASLGQPLPHEA